MKICIPTEGDEGLAAAVAGHLGRAPFLTLVDTESGELAVLANAPHTAGACRPAAPLVGRGIEAVVCAGAGRGAVAALEAAGIRVLVTGAERVRDAVAAVRQGELRVLGAAEACQGHHGSEQRVEMRCRRHA
jgi:predicted Fe-Mo cluster-binding NifX family protein